MSLLSEDKAYVGQVERALDQANLDVSEAKDCVGLALHCIRQGRRWPWWQVNEQAILASVGGTRALVLDIISLAIALRVKDGELGLLDSLTAAVDEFQKSIRSQYDQGDEAAVTYSLEELAEREWGNEPVGSVQDQMDILVHKFGVNPEPPPEHFDPNTQLTDPRLIEAWQLATPAQREVLEQVANGVTVLDAGRHIDGQRSTGWNRVNNLRTKLRKHGMLASGPA